MTGACRPTPNLDAIIEHALAPWVVPEQLPIVINIMREDLLAAGEIKEWREGTIGGQMVGLQPTGRLHRVLVVPLVADEDTKEQHD